MTHPLFETASRLRPPNRRHLIGINKEDVLVWIKKLLFAILLSFGPLVQCVVHALEDGQGDLHACI